MTRDTLDLDALARTIVAEAADAIVYADRSGTIGWWNRGAERLFGFTADEAIGRRLDIIIPESLRARHWEGYAATMRTGRSRYGAGDLLAVPGVRKDGSRVSLEFTIVPIADPAGGFAGIAALLRDVTARFNELKALRAEIKKLQPDDAGD
jgi:PAS domain S-box-containing protein